MKVEDTNEEEDGPKAGLDTTSVDSRMGFGLGLGFKGNEKHVVQEQKDDFLPSAFGKKIVTNLNWITKMWAKFFISSYS